MRCHRIQEVLPSDHPGLISYKTRSKRSLSHSEEGCGLSTCMELTHGFPSHRSAPKMRGRRHPAHSILSMHMKYDETCTYLLITSAF